jgi:hypothetical protein
MPTARTKKSSMQRIKDKVLDRVWEAEFSNLTRFTRVFHSLIKIALMVARDFIEKFVKLQAMALAFKTLLLAPLLAVVSRSLGASARKTHGTGAGRSARSLGKGARRSRSI